MLLRDGEKGAPRGEGEGGISPEKAYGKDPDGHFALSERGQKDPRGGASIWNGMF